MNEHPPTRRDISIIKNLLIAFCLCWPSALQAAEKPNVILIMADDLGWGELGCYGQEKNKTPHIDRLAAEGMRFTQFYAGSAICAASRCILMTGYHGGHAYIRSNSGGIPPRNQFTGQTPFTGQAPLRPEDPTIAKTFKAHGYATGCFGKWGLGGLGNSGDPLKQGFDRFYGYHCHWHAHNLYPRYLVDDDRNVDLPGNTRGATGDTYAPRAIADQLLAFVDKNKDKPFFIYYPTLLPHLPLQVPDEQLNRYAGKWPEKPYRGKWDSPPHASPRACYAGMISFFDDQIGRLIAALKDRNLDENTLVLLTSDNGVSNERKQVDAPFFNSTGGLSGCKGKLQEGGIRVPLIARWPGHIPAGVVSDQVAVQYDLPATLAELIGASFAEDTDGVSLVPTLTDRGEQPQHDYLFWDFPGYGGQLAVRMGDWKGIRQNLKKNPDAPLHLYNLKEDPYEKRNLAAKYPEIVKKIARIMIEGRRPPDFDEFHFGTYGAP